MATLSTLLIISECFALISSTCNYIDFGLYAIPETVCVEEDIYVTATRATFSLSYKYNCDATDPTTMEKPNWLCWATGDFMSSMCAFKYCPVGFDADGSTNIVVGDLGHDYQKTNSFDNLPVTDIQCNAGTVCPYVRVKNYDQDPAGLPFNGNIIPIVINECVSKKIFGCNQTNYWRVDYNDNQCTQPNSIYFYDIEPSTFPKHTVEECTAITTAPTDIAVATALPVCVSGAALTFLNQRYAWLKYEETLSSDIFECETCVGFDAYIHGYTASSGSQYLLISPDQDTSSHWAICYVGDKGATYQFDVRDCQTWFRWVSDEEGYVADSGMISVECTPEPTANPTQATSIPTVSPTSVTAIPTQATSVPSVSPTRASLAPTVSPIDGPNAMGNEETSQKTPLTKQRKHGQNTMAEMYLIIAGIALIVGVMICIGFYKLWQKRNNDCQYSVSGNAAITMGQTHSVQSVDVDGEDQEFV